MLLVLVEFFQNCLEEVVDIIDFVVFGVVDVEEERKSSLVDLFVLGVVYEIHEVFLQF